MRLDPKDRKFLTDWKEKRETKFQFILGVTLQVILGALTYKLVITYFMGGIFDTTDFILFGIIGLILGIVVGFLKYRKNEKRYARLKS
ncbi:hypothetical protein [Leeuwenhoekiella palythoae]|uniref:F0F1-ATPase subunit Ca2+/Mg2+ transporter n=1 Tax=Leeuwenhoekiella palythoae TaxID=573501 RepID=A0A1M5TNH6_9FLAO|nr:hypothetical protein [Leeuwenhoekiella palythoae]RXG28606.1 hypothetical protein DSM01_2067 [Leeuwenhoekiella palythoae]SHH52239.1 hypothetical protein SAMN04487999_0408 [Leeuwenhoekiella palythoae]